MAAPGVNLLELDEHAHARIRTRGATSCYIDYHPSFGGSPFGKVLCTSVGDAALHGLPHDYALQSGDLLSVDFAVEIDGWVSDAARSVVVGQSTAELDTLITATEEALDRGHGVGKFDVVTGAQKKAPSNAPSYTKVFAIR